MKILNFFRKKPKNIKMPQRKAREQSSPAAIGGVMRRGDGAALADQFIEMAKKKRPRLKHDDLDLDPYWLKHENVLAIHFADGGAQGDPGAIRFLYRTPYGIQLLYGNYVYGNLNLDTVLEKIPMLRYLDSRFCLEHLPYPFGGDLEIPTDWGYLYMGAMNHFYIRQEINEEAREFINRYLTGGGGKWLILEAIAWLYGMEPTN